MDRNFEDRRNNGRNFRNRRNDGRNIKNDRRNHDSNSGTKKDNEDKINVVSELGEELNDAFAKVFDISKYKLDYETRRLKSVIKFDSIKLN